MQLLKTVAIDVTTRGSLGKCLAVRVGEVLTTMKSVGVEVSLTRAAVEKALLNTHQGRKSQQKFLHSTSCDTTVKHPCKGIGGNTQNHRCTIIQQDRVDEDTLLTIRQGMIYILQ